MGLSVKNPVLGKSGKVVCTCESYGPGRKPMWVMWSGQKTTRRRWAVEI